jgi:uncharacterized membrane protein
MDRPLLEITLRPHRSLSRTGFMAVMAVLIAFNFVAGIVFLVVGAWPVIGFLGLDLLLVWGAFKLSYARGRASEHLELFADRLAIRRRDHWGRERRVELQPYWLQVVFDDRPGGAARLALRSHGRSHVIGAFLPGEERAQLAGYLRDALAALREGRAMPAPRPQPSPRTSFIV